MGDIDRDNGVSYRTIETIEPRARRKVPLRSGRGLYDWMNKVNSGENLSGVTSSNRRITMEEVRQHCTWNDAWLVLRGVVYNVTPYLEYHPGGVDELLRGVGRDCTPLFDEVHSWVNIGAFLARSKVGVLSGPSNMSRPAGPPALFSKASLLSVHQPLIHAQYNHDCKLFVFRSPGPVALQPGQHIKLKATVNGRLVIRPYTPVKIVKSEQHTDIEILIKIYRDGEMTQYLNQLGPGEEIALQVAPNHFRLKSPPSAIGMSREGSSSKNRKTGMLFMQPWAIAGGTGISPFIRILEELRTAALPLSLLSTNRTARDVLYHDWLADYHTQHPNFTVFHTVSGPTDSSWSGLSGRISAAMLQETMPAPAPGVKVLVCGPIQMVNEVVAMLLRLGYTSEMIHEFVCGPGDKEQFTVDLGSETCI